MGKKLHQILGWLLIILGPPLFFGAGWVFRGDFAPRVVQMQPDPLVTQFSALMPPDRYAVLAALTKGQSVLMNVEWHGQTFSMHAPAIIQGVTIDSVRDSCSWPSLIYVQGDAGVAIVGNRAKEAAR